MRVFSVGVGEDQIQGVFDLDVFFYRLVAGVVRFFCRAKLVLWSGKGLVGGCE